MLITLEHSGSADHMKLANELQDMIENDLNGDYTVEQVIGNQHARSISVYDSDLELIAIFPKLPTLLELAFYINISDTEE